MKATKATNSKGYQKIIQALVSARKNEELSQADLADRLDRLQSFVAKYELFKRRLDIAELVEICRALRVSPVAVMLQAGLIDEDDLKV